VKTASEMTYTVSSGALNSTPTPTNDMICSGVFNLSCLNLNLSCLQCFDAVGWVAGRASGL